MAPATANPELSFTVPSMAPGAPPWASADWADADPGINIIQRAGTRPRSIEQSIDLRTAAASELTKRLSVMLPGVPFVRFLYPEMTRIGT